MKALEIMMPFMAWADRDGRIYWHEVGWGGWGPAQLLDDRRTTAGPALGENAGTFYMAWRGAKYPAYEGGPITVDNRIWWSRLVNEETSPRHWAPQEQLADRETDSNPALGAAPNRNLYMAWKGANDPVVFWSQLVGDRWSQPQALPFDDYTDCGPALGSDGNRLCIAWKSISFGNRISWAEWDGSQWRNHGPLEDRATSHSPALGSGGSQLLMAWKGAASDRAIWWSINDGDSWTPQRALTDRWTDAQPALMLAAGVPFMAWRDGTQILSSHLEGDEWSAPQLVASDAGLLAGPALA